MAAAATPVFRRKPESPLGAILIEPRGGQRLVVSPDNPSAFVAALQARLSNDSPGR
jgi:hypothetical protein